MLYTVVLDYLGGTYISQVDAGGVGNALKVWSEAFAVGSEAGLDPLRKAELVADIKVNFSNGEEPALLDGLVNAWCTTASTSGGLALINVVATLGQKTNRSRSKRNGQ